MNVFAKKKYSQPNIILSKDDIINSIPKNYLNTQSNDENIKYKTEFRWRIFKLPNIHNELIEISLKKYNENRLFMHKDGNWKEYNDCMDNYMQYLIKEYYYYAEPE